MFFRKNKNFKQITKYRKSEKLLDIWVNDKRVWIIHEIHETVDLFVKSIVEMICNENPFWKLVSQQIESLFQISLAIFDTYCLAEASPGSTHFRSFGISFLFVYSGNPHSISIENSFLFIWLQLFFSVRRTLIAIAVILFCAAVYLLVSSLILMTALRKEHEIKFIHWLRAMAFFIVWKTLTIIFQSLVNVRQHSFSFKIVWNYYCSIFGKTQLLFVFLIQNLPILQIFLNSFWNIVYYLKFYSNS